MLPTSASSSVEEISERKILVMKELCEAAMILADCMLLTALAVFNLRIGIQKWLWGSGI